MKDAKENRYLLHSVLREIQELMAVTRPIYRRLSLSPGQLKFRGRGNGKSANVCPTYGLPPRADLRTSYSKIP
jgi:hypothetical protein